MRTNAPDIDHLDPEFYHGDKPVVIALYIEYKVLIAYGIDTVEIFFDIRKAVPLGIAGLLVPLFERCLRIGMFSLKHNQCLASDYSHT